ncbi:MAG: RagB/SusD family nutrient uptake outer membrane protein [Williamsia sp.]|nr:RagB/SusD family nutrient uptake outer membrane protein [Williamsia sp.]
MKQQSYLAIFLLGLLGFTACKKTYLNDLKVENGNLTEDIIFTTRAGAESVLTGIYWIYRSENYNGYASTYNNTGGGGLTLRGLELDQFFFDVRGNDVFSDPTGFWSPETGWGENTLGRISTGIRTKATWEMFYKVINNANAVIKNVPKIPEAQTVKDQLTAEAKALRAYSYFWLVRYYQFNYAKNPDAKAVPIYTDPFDGNGDGKARASLKEVYDLIIADLNEAVTNLTATRVAKYRINKNVAQGILAQVYQEMAGNVSNSPYWEQARLNAAAARSGFSLMTNATYQAGFNDLANGEWMWGLPVPVDQTLSYYSLFSYIDPDNGYYRNIYVNDAFVNVFTATDTRKTLFRKLTANAATPWKLWQTTKYKAKTATSGDILIMRSVEMVFIEAEALAQQGKLSEAIDLLFTLQSLRDPAAVKLAASSTKDDLINAILLERRKELFAEIGTEYLDLRRYQRPLLRTGNHWSPQSIPADDKRWLFQIPQSEVDANPNINDADQNP